MTTLELWYQLTGDQAQVGGHPAIARCVLEMAKQDQILKAEADSYLTQKSFNIIVLIAHFKTGWSPDSKVTVRLKQLLTTLGADENDINRIQLELLREQDVATLLLKTEKRKHLVIEWDEKELPEDTKPFMKHDVPTRDWSEAVEYLTRRGFDVTDNRFLYSTSKTHGRVNKRFILPFTYKGKVVGYTARWAGESIPDGMPKYYNQQPKKDFVYGLDRQRPRQAHCYCYRRTT